MTGAALGFAGGGRWADGDAICHYDPTKLTGTIGCLTDIQLHQHSHDMLTAESTDCKCEEHTPLCVTNLRYESTLASPTYSTSDADDDSHPSRTTQSMGARESIIRFFLLPSQVSTILLLEFMNTFRSYGLRVVLYNYITNEYNIGDTRSGVLMGIKSLVDIGVGLLGSILVDFIGVRRVSITALSIAIVGRTLLAFGKTTTTLYLALFVLSPFGDALLSVGLYRVALKKLTTPTTRPLAFAISYASQNWAGVCVALFVDWMRRGVDMEVNGMVFTPVRQFVVSSSCYWR